MANIHIPLLPAADFELLIELIFAHTKQHVSDFLQGKNIPYTGTKETLEERIRTGIDQRAISHEELVALLDDIEGWGNQHVYLYKLTEAAVEVLRDGDLVQQQFEAKGLGHLFNDGITVFIPEQPTLASSSHNDQTLNLKFVEQRRWSELIANEVEDHPDYGQLEVRKYRTRRGRGVNSVRVHLPTGQVEVMIQTLQSGTRYDEVRDNFLAEFDWIVPWVAMTLVETAKAIPAIEATDETRNRASILGTLTGSVAAFRSSQASADYRTDGDVKNARDALGDAVVGVMGNFYWLPTAPLLQEVHTHIYKDRIGFLGERTEIEVGYVLSRIRAYC